MENVIGCAEAVLARGQETANELPETRQMLSTRQTVSFISEISSLV